MFGASLLTLVLVLWAAASHHSKNSCSAVSYARRECDEVTPSSTIAVSEACPPDHTGVVLYAEFGEGSFPHVARFRRLSG